MILLVRATLIYKRKQSFFVVIHIRIFFFYIFISHHDHIYLLLLFCSLVGVLVMFSSLTCKVCICVPLHISHMVGD